MFHVKQFTSKTQKIGEIGENEAVIFLEKQGFILLKRNVSNKFGEIDIIAKKNNIHYFFEVKTGYKEGFVNPAENLTKNKLRKFFKSVEYYNFVENIKDYRVQALIVTFDREGSVTCETLDIN